MAAPNNNPFVPVRGMSAEDMLAEALDKLQGLHYPLETFTGPNINAAFLPVKKFVDAVRIIGNIGDDRVKRDVVTIGTTRGFYGQAADCTITQLYKFCNFLKTKEGTELIVGAQKRRALEGRAMPGQAIQNVALQSSFNEQRAEYGQSKKELRAQYEAEIVEMRRALTLKQEEMEVALHNLDVDFSPAPAYTEQDDDDLLRRCADLYAAECARLGRPRAIMDEAMLDTLRINYGDQARSEHIDAFLAQGNNAVDVRFWVDKKILQMEQVGDKRKATTFRGYMEAAGGQLDQAVRAAAAERSVKARRDRPARSRAAAGIDLANILTTRTRGAGAGRAPDAQAQAADIPPERGATNAPIVVEEQPQNPGAEGASGSGGGADPPRTE